MHIWNTVCLFLGLRSTTKCFHGSCFHRNALRVKGVGCGGVVSALVEMNCSLALKTTSQTIKQKGGVTHQNIQVQLNVKGNIARRHETLQYAKRKRIIIIKISY